MTNQHPHVDATAYKETVAAVRQDPSLGKVTFCVESESIGGFRMNSKTGPLVQAGEKDESRRGRFTFETDEPTSLLGSDKAVSPGEYVLQALAGCYAATLVACATERGMVLKKIELDLECDFNLSGFLGIDNNVRAGAQQVRVGVAIDSPNSSKKEIADLVADLETRSPIRDTLANPVNVVTSVK